MIVMSYRSPWEKRGTERGEVGRGNQRTLAHSKQWTPQRKREELQMNYMEKSYQRQNTSIAALENSHFLLLIVLLKIEKMGRVTLARVRPKGSTFKLVDHLIC